MRLLLFRHAESESNRRSILRRSGSTTVAARAPDDPGDAPLTETGQDQAASMGNFWSEILRAAAEDGKLHFFVSPMLRALQTLDPLITKLQLGPDPAHKAQLHALVNSDLMETSGLWREQDKTALLDAIMKADPSVGDLFATGTPPEFVDGLLRGRQKSEIAREMSNNLANNNNDSTSPWQPCGLSKDEIQQRFPWAQAGVGIGVEGEHVPLLPRQGPWYCSGWESPPARIERANRVVCWLNHLRDKLPVDAVVVVVAHSDLNRLVMNRLFGYVDFLAVNKEGENNNNNDGTKSDDEKEADSARGVIAPPSDSGIQVTKVSFFIIRVFHILSVAIPFLWMGVVSPALYPSTHPSTRSLNSHARTRPPPPHTHIAPPHTHLHTNRHLAWCLSSVATTPLAPRYFSVKTKQKEGYVEL